MKERWFIWSYFSNNERKIRKQNEEKLTSRIFEIYDNHESLGLKDRQGQVDMSLDIIENYFNRKNVMIEAGVGIGKSFGYLIPALLIYELTHNPVIISTSSIQLSEQIRDDIEVISSKLGIEVDVVVGKGSTHYACASKAIDIISDDRNKKRYGNLWGMINKVSTGEIGERANLSYTITDREWSIVGVEKCSFERCIHRFGCAFYKMRNDIAGNSDKSFIIVNQDLLIRDIINKTEIGRELIVSFPALLIIDEAHNLEDKVRGQLTNTFSQRKIDRILDMALGNLQYDLTNEINEMKIMNYKLFTQVDIQIKSIIRETGFEIERYKVFQLYEIDFEMWDRVMDDLLTSYSTANETKRERQNNEMIEGLSELKKLFRALNSNDESFLVWSTKNANTIELNYCPTNIQHFLWTGMFNMLHSVVLTSATLCQKDNDYSYISNAIGYSGEYTESKKSPFDYNNNALMFIANDMPIYSSQDRISFLDAAIPRIIELCNITQGRTMVLLTAKEDLKYIASRINEIETSWKKHFQQDGSSQELVISKFRESKGVLFGTGVFWEGVNIPGPDLSQVIILRLPFPVPNDPIIEYKSSKSKNSLMEVMVPNMIIKLRQGAGRLIRSETDVGIISILDSRLSSESEKPYRHQTLESLPFTNKTETIHDVKVFAESKIVPHY